MKDVTRLVVVLLLLLAGGGAGTEQTNGYCIGTQCFTLVRDAVDFRLAEKHCEVKSGHLMTVRSSVSHDVLTILSGNFTGRFWIGLVLRSSCPDPEAAARLRGFQWVTGDNQSSHFNWASSFDSNCSAARCVSVSRDSDFKWVQEQCSQRAAGFFCEYNFNEMCGGLDAAEGDTVSYVTPLDFEVNDVLSLPPGSVATRMPSETRYVCFSQQWLQAPWSCEILEGGCEHKCAVGPKGLPTCYCPAGQSVNPDNHVTCEMDADHPCHAMGCQHACVETGDSFACMCDHGFKLAADGRSCVDINDCTDQRQCPRDNFRCVNTVGGFQCVCIDGFQLRGDDCVDQDECESAPCEHQCVNTAGSYTCKCYDGYRAEPSSPEKCELFCGEEECPAECDPNDRLSCRCPIGYIVEERADRSVCLDIDECSSFHCDQLCTNTYGSYVCACIPGYRLVGEYRCAKDDDGSGGSETPVPLTPTPEPPRPDPTGRPSAVPVGGLVGIIVCTVFFIVLVVFVTHHVLSRRGANKAQEGDAHGLHHVTSDR